MPGEWNVLVVLGGFAGIYAFVCNFYHTEFRAEVEWVRKFLTDVFCLMFIVFFYRTSIPSIILTLRGNWICAILIIWFPGETREFL